MNELVGRRVDNEVRPYHYEPGDYGYSGNRWWGMAPNGMRCNLEFHNVTEHEDGTITAEPSILVSNGIEQWHGWLRRGVWYE